MSDADDPDASQDRGDDAPSREVIRVDGPEAVDDAGDDGDPPADGDGVVNPDDLDIRDRDGVDETDDGRYVISTGSERDDPAGSVSPSESEEHARSTTAEASSTTAPDDPSVATDTAGSTVSADDEDPLDSVAAELGSLSSSHGFALAVAAGGETATLRVASGDPTDTLATALRWYARQVNPDGDADETITQLLAASDLDLD